MKGENGYAKGQKGSDSRGIAEMAKTAAETTTTIKAAVIAATAVAVVTAE